MMSENDFIRKVKLNYKNINDRLNRMKQSHEYLYWKKRGKMLFLITIIYYKYSRNKYFRFLNLWRLNDLVYEIYDIYLENKKLKKELEIIKKQLWKNW